MTGNPCYHHSDELKVDIHSMFFDSFFVSMLWVWIRCYQILSTGCWSHSDSDRSVKHVRRKLFSASEISLVLILAGVSCNINRVVVHQRIDFSCQNCNGVPVSHLPRHLFNIRLKEQLFYLFAQELWNRKSCIQMWTKQIELVPYRATKISRKTQKHIFFPLIAKLVCFSCVFCVRLWEWRKKHKEKEWLELKTSQS